jgi:cytosine/uracil/thiamine/allantoin permease
VDREALERILVQCGWEGSKTYLGAMC